MRPSFDTPLMAPWVEPAEDDEDAIADAPDVLNAGAERRKGSSTWENSGAELADYAARTFVRVVTQGSDAGEKLHLLSALKCRSSRCDRDVNGPRAALSATIETRLVRGETATMAYIGELPIDALSRPKCAPSLLRI